MNKVSPRFELGLEDSKSSVITDYTTRPLFFHNRDSNPGQLDESQ
jgi:hypothetical protein